MKFEELKSSLTNGVKPIYLIEGVDAFLRESSLKMLKDGFLEEPDLNLNNLSGADIKLDSEILYTAVQSYPFMSDKRFVVVRDYYPTAQELKSKTLKNVFLEPVDSSVLIIINSETSTGLKNLENVTYVDCSRLSSDIISKWIRAEAKKSDVIIDNRAISLIIEYCSSDMVKISGEVNKLISFVGNGGQISESEVELICNKDVDYKIYEISDAIGKGNREKALTLLNEMLAKNNNRYQLFTSVYYYFRKLLHVAISSLSDSELASSLGIKNANAIYVLRGQAKSFKVKRLKEIVDKFTEYDFAFKRGEVSEESAFWNAIFNSLIK